MIQVVGIGPGRREGRTIAADDALRRAEVIVGYTTYVELVRDEFAEKRFVTTGMRGEKERCVQALLLSREGRRVALICSGDAQVYGMASLLLGMAEESDEIEVIPGVTAALSAAAVRCFFDRSNHDVADIRILSAGTAEHSDTHKLLGAGVVSDLEQCLHLDHVMLLLS